MHDTLHRSSATARNGTRLQLVIRSQAREGNKWVASRDERFDTIELTVWLEADHSGGPSAFSARIVLIDAERAVSQTMAVTEEPFGQLGIPEATLLLARQLAGRPLYSSSNARAEW